MTSLKSTSVCKGGWASGNRTIEYAYDANGSVIEKKTTVTSTQAVLETVTYDYNLQNRLVSVSDGTTTVTYKYNPDGIRVQADDGTMVTDYLIDAYNHTGYAQVLEEWSGGTYPDITYTIGDDVISQYNSTDGTECLLYDGHGSTRQLVDSSEDITDAYSYDAYGVMLGGNPARGNSPATSLLYAGEQFDTDMQMYYTPQDHRSKSKSSRVVFCYHMASLLRGRVMHDTVPPNRMVISKNTHLVAIRRHKIEPPAENKKFTFLTGYERIRRLEYGCKEMGFFSKSFIWMAPLIQFTLLLCRNRRIYES